MRIVTDAGTVFIPLADMVDIEEEKRRLQSEISRTQAEIKRIENKLSNEGFTLKAPVAIVEAERQKLKKYQEIKSGIESAMAKLKTD